MYRTTNRPNTRIEVADALRGIAVAGIILFHAREHFNLYWSALDLPRAGFGSWEQPVADMLGFLLSGKMYAIFALLFGLSFFIQSDNQAQRGNDFSLRFAWRMVLLFGIGLVNAAIYNGDVLTYYALFGLLMIPIGKLPNRWVWVIAALLFIQPLELWQYFSGHTLSIRGIEGMETLYPTLATGPFAQSARASLVYGPISSFGWGLEHGRGTQTLLMFVLGMLAGRYRLFYDEGRNYERSLLARGPISVNDWQEMSDQAAKLNEYLVADGDEPVLCHNDFFGLNFLIDEDGNTSLIDWEYAGMGDYANDFGTFCVCEQLSEDEMLQALTSYFDRTPTDAEWRHNLGQVGMAGWCWYAWSLLKESEGDNVGEWAYIYYRHAKTYLKKALDLYEAAGK